MTVTASTVLQLNSDIRQTRVADEGVILRQNDGEILVVNDVAIRFLELLNGHADINTLAGMLLQEYNVEKEVLLSDLITYANELLSEGILVEA
jgi:hypothetical protein